MNHALEQINYELIKAHVLDPDNSPLPFNQQEMFNRIVSAAKILDKNPVLNQAVAVHHAKYNSISKTQAYQDIRLSMRLFNTFHTFNYDFWQTWLINDIVQNIITSRKTRSDKDRRVIAMEHANLLKAIGPKPDLLSDPKRAEKQEFYIMIQNNNQYIKYDLNNLQDLPPATLQELIYAIHGGNEISTSEAEEIMKS